MRYDFGFAPEGPYGRAIDLLEKVGGGSGVVVDLGCGHAAVGEPVGRLGYTYVGVDLEEASVAAVAERGLEAHVVDLRLGAGVAAELERVLGDRPLAALFALDAVEHIPNHLDLLAALSSFAAAHGEAPLVISIPNVTHRDLGVKLLTGRWDVTPTGLLDDTHVRFFGEDQLRRDFGASGWAEIARADYEQHISDQHFPDDLGALIMTTPLGGLLRQIREQAPAASINQFVRAYRPAEPVVPEPVRPPEGQVRPLLSIVTRTRGTRLPALEDLLTCLLAQTCRDFEVLLVLHDVPTARRERVEALVDTFPASLRSRVRLLEASGGGRVRPLKVAVAEATGRYLSIVDDDDLVLADYVEAFERQHALTPGQLLRAVVVEHDVTWLEGIPVRSSSIRTPYPADFDLVDHLMDNRTPCCGLAFPLTAFRDLGVSFDESLPVVEDWDVILQCALLLGVSDVRTTTSIYRRGAADASAVEHAEDEWVIARARVRDTLDRRHWVVGPGGLEAMRSVGRTREHVDHLYGLLQQAEASNHQLREEYEALGAHAHHLAKELAAVQSSVSLRVTRAVRLSRRAAAVPARLLRRARS